jgi:dUTP pyrophosphatase
MGAFPQLGLMPYSKPEPKFMLDDQHARMPHRAKPASLGFDLYSCQYTVLQPRETRLVPTGLRCQFNYGWGAYIWDRSGMGIKGLHRFAGVIESDYTGLWGVVLFNSLSTAWEISPKKAVAQVVFQETYMGEAQQVDQINMNTDRGEKGFGSTDGV